MQDVRAVSVHSMGAQVKKPGHFLVAFAFGHELQDFALLSG
jgi:hypothetical protein